MRIIMLTLCCFVGLLTSAHALEMYRCLDNSGNEIITSTPQDGMRDCVLKDSSEDSITEVSKKNQGSQRSIKESGDNDNQTDEKLRRKCAKLEDYRKEERTYCEGVPQSYNSGNAAMQKTAQDRMSSSSGSASQNCDYYRGLVKELEEKCR